MTYILAILLILPSIAFAGECEKHLAPGSEEKIAQEVQKNLESKGIPRSSARGYAILISTMLASAAATTYLSGQLPPQMQFLSHFLAQVSTLGVYVFGAPIWEPLASGFRKLAFGVKRQRMTESDPEFEDLWRRTQETYSLNAQMSRNVISQYLISVRQNFYEAYRAMREEDPRYAADQIAEAAFRIRTLFREIDPRDRSVANAVRTSFTRHIEVDAAFVFKVEETLQGLDPAFAEPETRAYYEALLRAWLGADE